MSRFFLTLLLVINLIFISCFNTDDVINTSEIANELSDSENNNSSVEAINEIEDDFDLYKVLSNVPGIVNPQNLDWPREVESMNGRITIEQPPERILTVSVGHDEMLFGFADISKIIAVSTFSQDPTGNIYDLTKNLPTISSEPEIIIAQKPDIVFADPYANPSLIASLNDFGIPVIQTQLQNDYEGRVADIMFTAYILDEIEGALELINIIGKKIEFIDDFKDNLDSLEIPSVLSVTYYDAYWAAGEGSTEGSIIELAGGLNIAAIEGVVSNNMITKEALILMNPDFIVIPQSVELGGQDFHDMLFNDESFQLIDAIINDNVYLVDANYFTTLSHWNIVGAEKLMKILWHENWDVLINKIPKFYPCMNCGLY